MIAPYSVFQTLDGPLNLAPFTLAMWGKLCVLLDLVIVRYGDDRDGSYRHNELLKRVLAAVQP